jgi:general secretion pathway protein I
MGLITDRLGVASGRSHGFTLIEVLIAVAVVAIALAAVMTEVNRDLVNTVALRDKTLAQWVAMNKVTEMQVSDAWPEPGEQRGEVEMARRDWYWLVRVSKTDDNNVRRVDVVVSDQRDARRPQATLLAYLGRPLK